MRDKPLKLPTDVLGTLKALLKTPPMPKARKPKGNKSKALKRGKAR